MIYAFDGERLPCIWAPNEDMDEVPPGDVEELVDGVKDLLEAVGAVGAKLRFGDNVDSVDPDVFRYLYALIDIRNLKAWYFNFTGVVVEEAYDMHDDEFLKEPFKQLVTLALQKDADRVELVKAVIMELKNNPDLTISQALKIQEQILEG